MQSATSKLTNAIPATPDPLELEIEPDDQNAWVVTTYDHDQVV